MNRQLMVSKCIKPLVLAKTDPTDATDDNAAELCLLETMDYAAKMGYLRPGEQCVCLYNLGASTVIKIVPYPENRNI